MTEKQTEAPRRRMSARTAAEIARRVEVAQAGLLGELAQLVLARQGRMNDSQVSAVATLLRDLGYDAVELETWLEQVGAPAELAASAVIAPSERPIGAAELRQVFLVTDAEEEALELIRLVSERRRSRLRRRAEGARPASSPVPKSVAPAPWEGTGKSRATWYRHERAAAPSAVREAVRRAGLVSQAEQQPWVADGISRATWYRRQRSTAVAGETEGETERDRITHVRTREFLSYYPVAASLTRSLPADPLFTGFSREQLRTAEARRLVGLAERLGFTWCRDRRLEQPRTWFGSPRHALSLDERQDWENAVQAAERGEQRRGAMDLARARVEARTNPAAARQSVLDALPDPQQCPARVSPAVWDQVPPEFRPWVRRHAGQLFLAGVDPDVAVTQAIEPAARQAALEAAIAAAVPGVETDRLRQLGRQWWHLPTAEGVRRALAELDERRCRREAAQAAVVAAIAGAQTPMAPDEAAQVTEKAVDCMLGWSNISVKHAISLAQDVLREQRQASHRGLAETSNQEYRAPT